MLTQYFLELRNLRAHLEEIESFFTDLLWFSDIFFFGHQCLSLDFFDFFIRNNCQEIIERQIDLLLLVIDDDAFSRILQGGHGLLANLWSLGVDDSIVDQPLALFLPLIEIYVLQSFGEMLHNIIERKWVCSEFIAHLLQLFVE